MKLTNLCVVFFAFNFFVFSKENSISHISLITDIHYIFFSIRWQFFIVNTFFLYHFKFTLKRFWSRFWSFWINYLYKSLHFSSLVYCPALWTTISASSSFKELSSSFLSECGRDKDATSRCLLLVGSLIFGSKVKLELQ